MKKIHDIFNIKSEKVKTHTTFELSEVIILILVAVVLSGLVTGYTINFINQSTGNKNSALKDIVETYSNIKDEYYEDVDEKKLADAAIDGMMKYLDEYYSEYMSDEESASLQEKLNGTYRGIGVSLLYEEDNVFIDSVFVGSPASDAGLKDDQILKINGEVVTNLEDVTASSLKDEDNITLTIIRDNVTKDFKVKLKDINNPVVKSNIFIRDNKKIGYLYLSCFSKDATRQVRNELGNLEEEGITSLVLDLRNNTGGYLEQARDIASLFLKKGKLIYSLENRVGIKKYVDETREERKYPIVVLVNGKTASASEILAASLKESYGAILVGTNTFGKGKVQQTSTLTDNKIIKYTTAKWYTPNGDSIDGIGIVPGIIISLDEKYVQNPSYDTDSQLQKALSVVK